MKFLPAVVFATGLLAVTACDKDKDDNGDKRNAYVGKYDMATAEASYHYDFTGQQWDRTGRDTAAFSISKAGGTDSADYIYIHGAAASQELFGEGGLYYNLARFTYNGERIVGKVTDSNFVIPMQTVYSNASLSIKSDGARIQDNKLTITYSAMYRGLTKTATFTLKRK